MIQIIKALLHYITLKHVHLTVCNLSKRQNNRYRDTDNKLVRKKDICNFSTQTYKEKKKEKHRNAIKYVYKNACQTIVDISCVKDGIENI